ncbi:MAG: universal stress protein [Gammaproteobacteria bacterium]|nr:universal stress protein [Gammaproteobacteria bacterium]
MRTLLVPFHGSDATQSALEMAHLVATRFGSYIEGLFVLQPPPIIAGEGITIPGEYLTQLAEEGRRLADGARERFEKFMKERHVPFRDITIVGDNATAGWRELEGLESQVVGEYGRLFDLIVVGCATQQSAADRNAMCEAALFESGRPVMVAADKAPATLGKTIVVAWNGSTETARTIALGMPLLQAAEKVVVLTVQGGTVPGPDAEQVTRHLVHNDINAQTEIVEPGPRTSGEAILEETDRVGADLLLKGAFTHSRLRQMIFGGATQHILSVSKVPVFMAH